ncbi:MAG: hypothetical protein WAU01_01135 [Saprospiraceae bacterium]
MIKSMLIAILGIIGLMVVWALIQTLWRSTFQEFITDEDVLAGRNSCDNCGCTKVCSNKKSI